MIKIAVLLIFIPNILLAKTITATKVPLINEFINTMVDKHQFKAKELNLLFDNIELTIEKKSTNKNKRVKKAKKRITWMKYKKIFLTENRIKNGAKFIQKYKKYLQQAEDKFGVPKAIITAILGIETNYGQHNGDYPVMATLTRLAFSTNNRKKFYKKELEEFLLLARENSIPPLGIKGSHAGAMGQSQFIASSYRYYAIDFNNDSKIDLFNPIDAIGSIANYFAKHYWQKDGLFVLPSNIENKKYAKQSTNKPRIKVSNWRNKGVKIKDATNNNIKAAFINLKTNDKDEIWLTFWNFYVITRYNHDNMYAMTAIMLANKIIKQYNKQYDDI